MSSLSCFPHYCSQSPHLYPCWWELMQISSWRMAVLSKQPKCWKNLGSKNSFFSLSAIYCICTIQYALLKATSRLFSLKIIQINPRFINEWEHNLRFYWSLGKNKLPMGFYFDRKKPDDPRILAQLISAYSQFDPEKAKLYPCILCTSTYIYLLYSELIS